MDKWDEHFKPLLSCHDPKEPEQKGGLLRAQYGKGTYIYTGYSFFRQLPAGVPGAVRLFVNLLAPRVAIGRRDVACCVFSSSWWEYDCQQPLYEMQSSKESVTNSSGLIRGMGLGSATALNMIDMIGVGPFITMPLVLIAMGGPQAMLGWIAGALLGGLRWTGIRRIGRGLPGFGWIVSLPE